MNPKARFRNLSQQVVEYYTLRFAGLKYLNNQKNQSL